MVNNATLLNDLNTNFETIAPIAFIYERDSNRSKTISRKIRKFYFDNKTITKNEVSGLQKVSKLNCESCSGKNWLTKFYNFNKR